MRWTPCRCDLPLYKTVMEKIGKPVVFNIALLGALLAIKPVVGMEAITSVLESRLPWEFLPLNKMALELGYELGKGCPGRL